MRPVAALLIVMAALAAPVRAAEPAAPSKVLRYSFRIAETGFDPAQISDLYSRTIAAGLYEAPYEYEFMAKPVRVRPATAAAMPEGSADWKTWTVRLKPGIFFTDHPAFKGKPRELTAADYAYSLKRHFDPFWKSPHYSTLAENEFLGLEALRTEALETGRFDYDRVVPGIEAIDRYTLRFRLAQPNPRFVHELTDPSLAGAVAREVVETYGLAVTEHPVGTGSFRLAEWRRSSKIVLEKNPGYRDSFHDEHPPESDARATADAARLRGRKLPMLDRVEISIVQENQPRWLTFLRGEHDVLEQVPEDFTPLAIPNNRIAPNLEKQGIYAVRYQRNDISASYFAMESPVVGGYAPGQVALRRAISLAVDIDREIAQVRRGQAIPAQSPMGPGVTGYDPAFHSEMSEFSRAKAMALLDLYGFVDKDGDGWRDRPDGSPLVLEYSTQADDLSRQLVTQWQKNMNAIGIRIVFKIAQWPENLKASRAGKLMMWGVGWSAGPDGTGFLALGYSPASGQSNHARFRLPEFDRLYEQARRMPDGPERLEVMTRAKELMVAYMPYRAHVHRIWTDLAQPWVVGYGRNLFMREFWRYVDIDRDEKARRAK